MDLFDNETTEIVQQKKIIAIDPKTKRFNNLLKKIEYLEKKVVSTQNHYEEVYTDYKTKFEPLKVQGHEVRLKLIKTAYNAIPKLGLNKSETDAVTEMMIDELEEISFHADLDEDTKRIYESLNKITIDQANKKAMQFGIEMLNETMKENGLQMDMNNYDMTKLSREDPEEMAKFARDLMEKKAEAEAAQHNKKFQRKEKKKTKKQLEKEAQQLEKEDFEKRSLKSLYNSLAKILHPDTEINDDLKIEKEEWMKQLTVAYQNQDLATMIKIEMHWLQTSKFDPNTAPEKQFNTYINFLNERVQELNFEIYCLGVNPRYAPIMEFLPINKYGFPITIQDAISDLQSGYIRINHLIELLQIKDVSRGRQKKRELNEYVADFWNARTNIFDPLEDDDFFK